MLATEEHRTQLRLMVRRYDQVMLTYLKAAKSMGESFEKPEDPPAIASARAELKNIRVSLQKAKRDALSSGEKLQARERVKASMDKRSEFYKAKRKKWAEENKDLMRSYQRDYMRRLRLAKKEEEQRPELAGSVSFQGGGVFSGLYSAFGIGQKQTY